MRGADRSILVYVEPIAPAELTPTRGEIYAAFAPAGGQPRSAEGGLSASRPQSAESHRETRCVSSCRAIPIPPQRGTARPTHSGVPPQAHMDQR